MKAKMISKTGFLLAATTVTAFAIGASGCSFGKSGSNSEYATGTGPGLQVPTFSSTVANLDSVAGRVESALTPPATTASPTPSPLVNTSSTNFMAALAQQGPNLAATSNPTTATGANAIPLIAYGACSDVIATKALAAAYGITPSTSTPSATVQTALVNAGITIINQCTAGLAAAGTQLNSQVASVFTTLLAANAGASPAATTTQDFVSVCTAATELCTGMLSF